MEYNRLISRQDRVADLSRKTAAAGRAEMVFNEELNPVRRTTRRVGLVMSTSRETFFECSFTFGFDRRTAHVRAWSAAEAERLFREELEEEGAEEAGTIVVAGGQERRSSRLGRKTVAH